jgi:hypothetical protein
VARRRLNVRRIDPWSVLKFGAVANIVLLLIGLLVVGVVFYIIERIGLVDQVCEMVIEVGFQECGVNAGNLFRAIALLGLLGVVILTAVLVFLAFLHNLIADLTGGLSFTVLDDTPTEPRPVTVAATSTATTPRTSSRAPMNASGTAGRSATPGPPVPPLGRDQNTVEHDRVRGSGDDGDLFGR